MLLHWCIEALNSLQYILNSPVFVGAHKLIGFQEFLFEAAMERFDLGIIVKFSRTIEVEYDIIFDLTVLSVQLRNNARICNDTNLSDRR